MLPLGGLAGVVFMILVVGWGLDKGKGGEGFARIALLQRQVAAGGCSPSQRGEKEKGQEQSNF